MASSQLPTGELARRNKGREPPPPPPLNDEHVVVVATAADQNNKAEAEGEKTVLTESNVMNVLPDWKMAALYHQQNGSVDCFNGGGNNYRSSSFSSSSLQSIVEESANNNNNNKLGGGGGGGGGAHFSNSSSLVTSLNSSREASPDRNGTVFFSKPPSPSPSPSAKFVDVSPTASLNSWIIPSAAQQLMRPAVQISMAHLPVFTAWGDI